MGKAHVPKGSRRGKGGKRGDRRGGVSKNGVDYHGASKDGSLCSSGKWGWTNRAGAKTLLRALRHGGDHGSRVYRCPECDRFHVGHIPVDVRQGKLGVRDVYGRDDEATA